MARNKAIFDADILINMVNTKSLDYLIPKFEKIYVSDYVWNVEIKEGTEEKRVLSKPKNNGFIIVLEYNRLTERQQAIYRLTYEILKSKAHIEAVNEGERITASFAKANSVAYYMSDDNKAAPYISSLADVSVINYCDLLFIAYSNEPENVKQIANHFNDYLLIFGGQTPKIFLDRGGSVLDFPTVMAKCHDKFNRNRQLKDLLSLLVNRGAAPSPLGKARTTGFLSGHSGTAGLRFD